MTPHEFKSWFNGFSEGIHGNPTVKQWDKICQKVKTIDGNPISQTVIREYVRDWRPLYNQSLHYSPHCPPYWAQTFGVSGVAAAQPATSAVWQMNSADALKQMGRDDLAAC